MSERERCPKCGETERHYWCRCGTLIEGTVCPVCDRTREEAMERGHADDTIPLACGTEITPDGRVILEGEVCLRRQLAQAQEENYRLRRERKMLVKALMPASEALADLDKSYYRDVRQYPVGYVMGDVSVASLVTVIESTRKALALLDGEKGGDADE